MGESISSAKVTQAIPSGERPVGITILAGLCFLYGAYQGIGALKGTSVLFAGGPGGLLVYPVHAIIFLLTIAFFLGIAALLVLVGIGLIRLKNWARMTLVVLIGLQTLLVAVLLASHGLRVVSPLRPLLGGLIILGVLAYLFQPHVKQAFGANES